MSTIPLLRHAFAPQLDEDFNKSGQNQNIEEFASSWQQRGVLFMRLCLNKLKDEGDETIGDLCTATLPVDVGVGYARHHINESGNASDSSSDYDDGHSTSGKSSSRKSSSSKPRKPFAKKSRKNAGQDNIADAARAIREANEAKQKKYSENTRHEYDRAQAVSSYTKTMIELMRQYSESTDDEQKELCKEMMADIKRRLADLK